MSSGGPDSDLRRRLARIAQEAGRAPSKHNTQPWRFLVRDSTLEVWADRSRSLPESDPHSRELVLACGAAAQTALVVARAEGLDLGLVALPNGAAGPVAPDRPG